MRQVWPASGARHIRANPQQPADPPPNTQPLLLREREQRRRPARRSAPDRRCGHSRRRPRYRRYAWIGAGRRCCLSTDAGASAGPRSRARGRSHLVPSERPAPSRRDDCIQAGSESAASVEFGHSATIFAAAPFRARTTVGCSADRDCRGSSVSTLRRPARLNRATGSVEHFSMASAASTPIASRDARVRGRRAAERRPASHPPQRKGSRNGG